MPSEEESSRHQVSVVDLSDTMAGSLRNMATAGPGVCPICWTFHDPSYDQCAACVGASELDVVIPISYAMRGQQLATALRGYKDEFFPQTRAFHGMRLAAILWRFLAEHEPHVAAAANTSGFHVVAVVPSKTTQSDDARRGLRTIAGTVVEHTAPRFERLLRPTDAQIVGRYFDPGRYATARRLDGESVLLIDDTWVTGSSAQAAGAALREAGAAHVGCVVIGCWLRPDFGGDWGNVGDIHNRLPCSSTGRTAPPSNGDVGRKRVAPGPDPPPKHVAARAPSSPALRVAARVLTDQGWTTPPRRAWRGPCPITTRPPAQGRPHASSATCASSPFSVASPSSRRAPASRPRA